MAPLSHQRSKRDLFYVQLVMGDSVAHAAQLTFWQ